MGCLPKENSTEYVSLSHQKQAIVINTTSLSRTIYPVAGDRYDEYSKQRVRLPLMRIVNMDTGTDGRISRQESIVSSPLRTISGELISHTPILTISDQSMSARIFSLQSRPIICTNRISTQLANMRRLQYSNSSNLDSIYFCGIIILLENLYQIL